MRPVTLRLAAAGVTPWVLVNRIQENFNVGLSVVLSSGAALTYTVQHTFDNLHEDLTCKISRTTTVSTITRTNHGLSAADYAQILSAGDANLNGEFAVATYVDANNFTVTVSNTGATADNGFALLHIARVFPNLTLAALTASGDGNYVNPIQACRLKISAYTSGFADFTVLQGM